MVFRAGLVGKFAPDGYTWAEYFELDKGHKSTAKELKTYIKERSTYKEFLIFSLPIENIEDLF